jgi:hypothetical protein
VNGFRIFPVLVLAGLVAAGCVPLGERQPGVKARPFEVEDLVKSDSDLIMEIQISFSMEYLELLMEKLYRRNPKEWRKSGQGSLEKAVARVFGPRRPGYFPELRGKRSVDSMRLAFDENYRGDRVLALVEGLRGMILDSYNGKQELYILDELDPQKLYHAARNIEIAIWKLSNDQDSQGRLFLISNETAGPIRNLSFERLFGKLIALQDSSARIVAEGTNRRIKNVIQSVAQAVFFPI